MSAGLERRSDAAQPFVTQVRDRRFWAAIIDVWALAWVLGVGARAVVTVPLDLTALGAIVGLPILVAAEARSGRTPGKALMRLRTQQVGGESVGWQQALRRRSWMALPAVGLLPGIPTEAGGFLLFGAAVTLVISMGRSPDGRGWHDRLADTDVVASDGARLSALLVVLGAVGALLVVAVGWWFHTPEVGSESFSSFSDAQRITCDVTHDGWLYPRHERTVTLQPGSGPFTGRFGPHDVTLAFIDDMDGTATQRGLRTDVATRSLLGTTGRSTGTDDRSLDVTTGLGLGELTIDCRADQ